MYCLEIIRQNLDERQFTQLAHNLKKNNFVVSAYFRHSNKFKSIEYEYYTDANEFYKELIK